MRAAEKQSALEALTRSPGWLLVVEHLEEMHRQNTEKLLGIKGPAGISEAPVWASVAREARKLIDWPNEQVKQIMRLNEQGERDAR